MRLPLPRLTPLECVLWAGAGLLWAFAGGVPIASLFAPARPAAGLVQVIDSPICRAPGPTAQSRMIFSTARE